MTLLKREPLSRTAVVGRLMDCSGCGALVDVIELPTPFLDQRRYRCPDCLHPVAETRAKLQLVPTFTSPPPELG